MKKITAIAFIVSLFATNLYAQSEVTMTKAEFVDSQMNMLANAEKMMAEMKADNDQMMKDRMPADQYQQFKADQEQAEKLGREVMAECLGLSLEGMDAMEKHLGPEFQVEVVNECSNELPESISFDAHDMGGSQALAGYTSCSKNKVADKLGISVEKLEQCSEMERP